MPIKPPMTPPKTPISHESSEGSVAVGLPVLGGGRGGDGKKQPMRKSRNARRRAVVLGLVQLLMVIHLVQWWITGKTTTPVEPSEAMETVKEGVINVGTIFFAVVLLSTLVLGRWFCGWGCHLVMLQDLCGWMMRKMGVRPKPFRSRLLVFVPLILGLYMFVWPVFYRLAVAPWTHPELEWGGFSTRLTTSGFWDTMPGWWVGIPFLLVCGFATVYFLGAKGYCTYGCPYGGFFTPLDTLAPARIRVTDACEQCGHCTATCTSNVRVHEEVREYGMVVDPGCMKTLDCVSVCPNDALYFGLGRPSVGKGEAKNKAPRRKYDLSWGEEFAVAGLFAFSFFAVRGIYGVVPLLFAAGVAGCTAFLGWRSWRIVRDENVNLYRFRLKYRGKVGWSGGVFLGGTLLVLLFTGHSFAVQAGGWLGAREVRLIQSARQAHHFEAQSTDETAGRISEEREEARLQLEQERLRRAVRYYQWATPWYRSGDGGHGVFLRGIGLAATPQFDFTLASVHWTLREYKIASGYARYAIEWAFPKISEGDSSDLAIYLRDGESQEAAEVFVRRMLEEHPDYVSLWDILIRGRAVQGKDDEAALIIEEAIESHPNDPALMYQMALRSFEIGRFEKVEELARRSIGLDNSRPNVRIILARALAARGDLEGALKEMLEGANMPGAGPHLWNDLANLLDSMGRGEEARRWRAKAIMGRNEGT